MCGLCRESGIVRDRDGGRSFAGCPPGLVIAGSDRHGTAMVFMNVGRIGVSPWYWWADVTPVHVRRLTFRLSVCGSGRRG